MSNQDQNDQYTYFEHISPAEVVRFCAIFLQLSGRASCRSGHLALHPLVSYCMIFMCYIPMYHVLCHNQAGGPVTVNRCITCCVITKLVVLWQS